MRGTLFQLATAAVFGASWMLSGYAMLPARVRREDPLLVWSTALALGAGTTAVALMALAALHAFSALAIGVVAAVAALGGLAGARRAARAGAFSLARPRVEGWPARLALAALGVVLVATLFSTLAPPSSMDATVYHLRVPREFLRARTWLKLEDPRSYQPLYVEMLFGEGLALAGPVTAALAHWILGLGAILSAGAWGRRLGTGATWAAVIFGGTALYTWEAPSAYIDLGLALWASLAFFWATRTDRGAAPVVLAGVFAGLAGGSKFTGLVAAALAALAALATAAPDWRRGVGRMVAVGAIAIAVAAPWYARDFVFTGDPFFPLAGRLFGVDASPKMLAPGTYGLGTDVGHLLTSAFDLLARGQSFDQGWAVGPAFLALAPIGALVARPRRLAMVLVGIGVAWWLMWFYSSPQTRLLLPICPTTAALAGVGASAAMRSGVPALRAGALAAVAIALAAALGTSSLAAARDARVVLGLESPASYLGRNSWNYTAYAAANRLLPSDARVAVDGGTNFYYLEPPATAVRERAPSAAALRARGFTHRLQLAPCPGASPRDGEPVLWEGTYPLRASRLRGGVVTQECARLTVLPPAP